MSRRAVFLDKDGTLVEDVPYNVDPRYIRFVPGAFESLRRLAEAEYEFIVVTNQPGVAQGFFLEKELRNVRSFFENEFRANGLSLLDFYYCPHHPHGEVPEYTAVCSCRKPAPGLLFKAAREHGIDLTQSWLIGDILDDVECGRKAGCRTVLINNGHETEWQLSPLRQPDLMAHNMEEAADIVLLLSRQYI